MYIVTTYEDECFGYSSGEWRFKSIVIGIFDKYDDAYDIAKKYENFDIVKIPVNTEMNVTIAVKDY